MATYSLGSSLKVSAIVNASQTTTSTGATTVYTVPANSYAIVHLAGRRAGTGNLKIGVYNASYLATPVSAGEDYAIDPVSTSAKSPQGTLYLGPGEVVTIGSSVSGQSVSLSVHGVVFINSP